MKSVLVTGGAGFIGSNFVRFWRAQSPADNLYVLDSLTYAGSRASITCLPDAQFYKLDINQTSLIEELLRDLAIDTIVHFAAETHVDRSIVGPDAFITANVVGTHSLLKAARAVWLDDAAIEHRFHHVSTDEIFGSLGAQDAAFVEDDPARPNSPYSASKAASNHLVRAYHQTFNLQATTTNCSNNYGAYQHPEKLIPRFIINALTGRNLPLFGDGQNIRDWLHVEDHCYALEAVLNRGRPGETYNIGGGEELTNAEVAQLLCEAIDAEFRSNQGLAHRFPDAPPSLGNRTDTLLTHVEDRKGHDRRYAINYQKAARELGYTPRQNFAEGIGDTVRWYLSNETWWRDIIK